MAFVHQSNHSQNIAPNHWNNHADFNTNSYPNRHPSQNATPTTNAFAPNNNTLLPTVKRAIQYWLDKSTIHITPRWILFTVLLSLFFLRIYLIQGYFIVAYGLGIFLLNNFIAFLSPLEDPSRPEDDGVGLPSTAKEGKEYRPFARRLPEFKFWMACTRGVGTSIVMTFFSVFDVPRQIAHMYKHRYVPISFGKSKYKDAGKERGEFGGGMAGSIGSGGNPSYGGGGGASYGGGGGATNYLRKRTNFLALGGTVLALVSRMSNCRKDGFNGVQSSMNSKQQYDTEGFLCFDF
eukprot:scaffold3786_cov204-Alexandrium_tamarense.AAC.34